MSDDVETHLAEFFDRQVERVATDLERAADRVRLMGRVQPRSGHTGAALNVMNEIRGLYANLPLESVVQAAADVEHEKQRKAQA